MALISIIEDFHPINDAKLLDVAKRCKPAIHHRVIEPEGAFYLKERYSSETKEVKLHELSQMALGKGENLCLDFGTHHVGRVTLAVSYQGSHPDAPALLKLKFAETLKELSENSDGYDGWISSSWIQEEYVHVDVLPSVIELPRRYAFRYLKITMMDTSPKYKITVEHAECLAQSSAYMRDARIRSFADHMLTDIYRVGVRTLHNCMQDVFEDGPKRDRRLWMGDLRLQAQANYAVFGDHRLVKRCLYLFGGSRFPDGKVAACLFTEPIVEADDTWLFDYSLFYVVALEEYLARSDDAEALSDLYETAMQQIDLAVDLLDEEGIVGEEAVANVFIDWCDELDKKVCAQGVLLYAIPYAIALAKRKGDGQRQEWLLGLQQRLKNAAYAKFYDEGEKCFVSGGQISTASQVWMVLAGVLDSEEAAGVMQRCREWMKNAPMTTPYMHHYYVMALLSCGLKEEALSHLKAYWGSMIEAGADTFWESWTPEDPDASPYGGAVVNSYCHAWSCTPVYILSEYFS